ncbi:glycoside hydrolase family 10 protein [Clostridium sp.]|uniref:glycoside hydrolase family 10 protein n=1 Tax=Clostridium sp. TaxID=1506 RepID=UPI003F3793ED
MHRKKFSTKIVAGLITTIMLIQPVIGFTEGVNSENKETKVELKISDGMYAILNNGEKILINGKNESRRENQIIIYTDSYGPKTNQNRWGREIVVDNNGIVTSNIGPGERDKDGGEEIPKRGFVLSAHGERRRELENIKVGEKIDLEGVSLVDLNKESHYELTVVNPNAENNPGGVDITGTPYPGFRGGDQLVVYTKEFGTNTGTNDYGSEIIVQGTLESGTIVSVGGNNSNIPEDGYVLSGHGKAASFLVNEGLVGANVKVDENTKKVTISVTPQSLLVTAKKDFEVARDSYEIAKNLMLDVDYEKSKESLNKCEYHLNKAVEIAEKINDGDTSSQTQFAFLDEVESVKKGSLDVQYFTMESRVVDARGVWHRPIEKNLEDVKNTLNELKENNINMLFIETFYHGYTINPTNNKVITQRPEFANANYGEYGNDILKAFVEEGKKMGIEVHAWVQNFRAGYKAGNNDVNPILSQEEYKDWALINYDGSDLTIHEDNYYFMDPSNPEVRDCLKDIYIELVKNYDLDGLQLDYIRYPVGQYKSDSGYGENEDSSMNQFKKEYNLSEDIDIRDLMDKDKNSDWQLWWNRWNEFKQNKVTTFVEEINNELKKVNSEILISTAIFPNIEEAKDKKMQDWPTWVESGYIDLTAPMAYYKDAKTVKEDVNDMVEYVGGNCLNYAGIAPTFIGLKPDQNAFQVQAAREGKAQGSIIFASQNLLGLSDVQHVLQSSTHRKEAITPHAELADVVGEVVDSIQNKSNNIYIPNNAMSIKDLEKLMVDLNNIKSLCDNNNIKLEKVSQEIEKSMSKLDKYVTGEAKNRIMEDLEYLKEILDTREKMNK